jgi:hypothetical protein
MGRSPAREDFWKSLLAQEVRSPSPAANVDENDVAQPADDCQAGINLINDSDKSCRTRTVENVIVEDGSIAPSIGSFSEIRDRRNPYVRKYRYLLPGR